jgi:bifunctional non-homologous end joining protein LigD
VAPRGKGGELDLERRRIPVSNLDKVLYPAAGLTKAQIINYYIRVSRWMLAAPACCVRRRSG